MTQLYKLIRETGFPAQGKAEGYTLGRLYRNGLLFCFTCEDEDRELEKNPGKKVKALSAIPRGRYRLVVSVSARFKRELPEVQGVPGFTGIRIHGGNRAEDSEGCILTGSVRTRDGVAKCADTVNEIVRLIKLADKNGEETWLEVA